MSKRNTRALTSIGLALALLSPAGALAADKHKAKAREPAGDLAAMEKRLARLEAELARRPKDVSAYGLPDTVEFCGKRVDLTDLDVRERMERELYVILGDRAQVVLWLKRARRVFPVVDRVTKAQGTCADLKYLAVVESGLRPGVTSRAAAHGWWQFLGPTAKDYGLSVDAGWDQRADLKASTEASVKYLVDLHERFGDWALAMAAYNTGLGRMQRSMDAQGQTDFWALDLFTEAERYVPRIIAVKTVFEDLQGYGFQMDVEDGWAPEPAGHVKLSVPSGVTVRVLDAARGSGITYRTLRRLNPMLAGDHFATGREMRVRVPKGQEQALRDWMTEAVRAEQSKGAVAKRSARRPTKRGAKKYTIRRGDSLWSVATSHEVSVSDLRSWNGLSGKSVLKPGQTLLIRR